MARDATVLNIQYPTYQWHSYSAVQIQDIEDVECLCPYLIIDIRVYRDRKLLFVGNQATFPIPY